MKVKSCMLGVVLFLSVVSLIGCDGGGGSSSPTSPSFTPNPGRWSGSNIQFNVSQDGSKLTTQGSSLERSASIILGWVPYSGACSGSVRFGDAIRDYPIDNLSFEVKFFDGVEIKGRFSSSTSASGTYSFSVNNPTLCSSGTVSGSGNWSASSGG